MGLLPAIRQAVIVGIGVVRQRSELLLLQVGQAVGIVVCGGVATGGSGEVSQFPNVVKTIVVAILQTVGQTIDVAIGATWIETEAVFLVIGQPVAIGVGGVTVGVIREVQLMGDFPIVRHAVVVGIRQGQIRAVKPLRRIGKTVAVRVIGRAGIQIAKESSFPVVGQAIKVGIEGDQGIGAAPQLGDVTHLIPIEIGIEGVIRGDVRITQADETFVRGSTEAPCEHLIGTGFDEGLIFPKRQVEGMLDEIGAAGPAPQREIITIQRAIIG